MTRPRHLRQPFAIAATVALAGCADATPVAPSPGHVPPTELRSPAAASVELNTTLAELRRVTAKYHDIDAAVADGFFPVIPECEPDESNTIPYANLERLLDGELDPSLPDALLYEPGENGQMTLVAVEMVLPYPLWTAAQPPQFLGVALQREDELGVWGLHVWIWRHNPEGVFAARNPRVSCPEGQ